MCEIFTCHKRYNIINMDKEKKIRWMRRAIELSEQSVIDGGGPFGAVIVKDGRIVAEGTNGVTLHHDPTAHAEVTAIRRAGEVLGTFDLSGCEIYTSCEPCPMCLGAIYWAHIDRIYYGNDRRAASAAGFDDEMLYREIALEPDLRSKRMTELLSSEALKAFDMWRSKTDKTPY